MKQVWKRRKASTRWLQFTALLVLSLAFAGWRTVKRQDSSGLIVHEWGTFTAIAGHDGNAMEWTPLPTPVVTDLPSFVEHLNTVYFKEGLAGRIRMETPVMYFYAPRETTVSVRVAFSKGIMSEWYPHADRVEPTGVLRSANLSTLQSDGTITWNDVVVSPSLDANFTKESQANRYYAARETSSSPLRVKTSTGDQQEKFLFYRGVSNASLPLSASLNSDGSLLVRNLEQDEIPAVILFERRGKRIGYRLETGLRNDFVLNPPELTGTVDSLSTHLEAILVRQGLFPDEAHAMVQTWQDSWFEEGSRLIYIVPQDYVNSILPVAIRPQPSQVLRVFVGRLEIVTPATVQAVETAVASHDDSTLKKYNRFVEPILQTAKGGYKNSDQQRVLAQSSRSR